MSLFQEIKKGFSIPDAYENWSAYRETLTNYLIKETDKIEIDLSDLSGELNKGYLQTESLPTLAIVGAGGLNDIDVRMLLPHFSKISLLDMDMETVKNALYREGIEHDERIEVVSFTLNGLEESNYESFTRKLEDYVREARDDISSESFGRYAMEIVDEQITSAFFNLESRLPDNYDYVWCMGVHSQLYCMYAYIFKAFLVNLKGTVFETIDWAEELFTRFLFQKASLMIPMVNDRLLHSCKEQLYVGCEWDLLLESQTEYICGDYPLNAVEGAYQTICDFRDRSELQSESMIMWPFDAENNRNYLMLIQKIKGIN